MLWRRIVLRGDVLLFRERTRSARGLAAAPASGRFPPHPRRSIHRRLRFFFAPYVGYLWLPLVLFGASWFVQAVQCSPWGSLTLPPRRPLYTQPVLMGRRWHYFFFFLNGKNAGSEPFFLTRSPRWSTPARALPLRHLSEPIYLPPPCSSRGAQSVPLCGPRCSTIRGIRGAINEPRGQRTR